MVGGYQHLPWKKLIANLRQHDYAMMDASSSSSFSSSPSISSSPHPSPFGDMTHVTWRSIHVEPIGSTDSFELLTKFQSDAEKGYHLLVTGEVCRILPRSFPPFFPNGISKLTQVINFLTYCLQQTWFMYGRRFLVLKASANKAVRWKMKVWSWPTCPKHWSMSEKPYTRGLIKGN